MRLGIIGTAGRKEDASKLNQQVWVQMNRAILNFVIEHKFKHLISGGAAYADHCAVMYYLGKVVDDITLHVPCTMYKERFAATKDGNTSNYYHHEFSRKVGIDSLAQLYQCKHKMIVDTNGFFAR